MTETYEADMTRLQHDLNVYRNSCRSVSERLKMRGTGPAVIMRCGMTLHVFPDVPETPEFQELSQFADDIWIISTWAWHGTLPAPCPPEGHQRRRAET